MCWKDNLFSKNDNFIDYEAIRVDQQKAKVIKHYPISQICQKCRLGVLKYPTSYTLISSWPWFVTKI